MEDAGIVELYWSRSEQAIVQTQDKYGSYLHHISYHIVGSREDAQECVNDTYHHAWNAMPPNRPSMLSTFLGKITRRLSIDRWRRANADKRGGGETALALEELGECVSGRESVEDELVRRELVRRLDSFLANLPDVQRRVFLCRYWYMESIQEIAGQFGFSRSKVTSMLHRTRSKLRTWLEEEGY